MRTFGLSQRVGEHRPYVRKFALKVGQGHDKKPKFPWRPINRVPGQFRSARERHDSEFTVFETVEAVGKIIPLICGIVDVFEKIENSLAVGRFDLLFGQQSQNACFVGNAHWAYKRPLLNLTEAEYLCYCNCDGVLQLGKCDDCAAN